MNNLFYDGFNSKLIETAFFEGFLEIPIVKSQVNHTTIRQKVYRKSSPQNVQVNG